MTRQGLAALLLSGLLPLLCGFGGPCGPGSFLRFDQAPAGEGKIPSGWWSYQKLDDNGRISVVDHDGVRAVRFDSYGRRGSNAVGLARNLSVMPGQPYRITVKLRNAGAGPAPKVGVNLIFCTPDDRWVNAEKLAVTDLPADRYGSYSLTGRAPEEVKRMVLELYVWWGETGSVLLSEIFVDPLTPDGFGSDAFGRTEIGPRELYLDTPLLRDGRAVAAIVTGGDAFAPLAAKLNAAIRARTGAELPVLPAAAYATADKFDRPLIMLGNCDDNAAVMNLYLRHHVILDARYPGPGGYNVRTLHNPFGDGRNVIFAGGSDPAGHAAAADRLAALIGEHGKPGELVLPRLREIEFPAADRIRLEWGCEWDGFFGYCPISRAMAAFYMTGDAKYIELMRETAFPATPEQIAKNNRSDRYDNGADPIAMPYHYWAMKMALYWDLIEEDPVFSPEERWRITRKLYEQLQYWIHCGYGGHRWYMVAVNALPQTKLRDRHYLMEALCLYTVARYFDKHYPSIDSREGLRAAGNVFAPLWDGVTPGLSWRAWLPSMFYPALQYGIWADPERCRTNPNFRAYGELMLLASSLREGEWMNGFPGIYGALAKLHRDAGYARMQRLILPDTVKTRIGQAFLTPGETLPTDYFARTAGRFVRSGITGERMAYANLPPDLPASAVDEIYAYRQRGDRTGDYLRLDARYRTGSRTGFFNFAIDELVLAGLPVLLGSSQPSWLPDGIAPGRETWYARVREYGKLGGTAIFRAGVPDFNGADWERTVLLRDNRFLLTVDTVTPREKSLLQLENAWRPAPYNGAEVRDNGDFVITPGGEVPEGDGVLVRLTGKALNLLDYPGGRFYDSFKNTVAWRDLAPDRPVTIPFHLEKATEGGLKLWLYGLDAPAPALDIRLDGEVILADYRLPPEATGRFYELELGLYPLAAGEHHLAIAPSSPAAAGASWNCGGFAVLAPARYAARPAFVLGCDLAARPEAVPVKLTGPDGGAMINSSKLVFRLALPAEQGVPLRLVSLLRPASDGEPAAVRHGGRTLLRLPEPARLEFTADGGFLLYEPGRLTGVGVREAPGLFRDAEPVTFTLENGRLLRLGADQKVTETPAPAGFRLPARDELAREVAAAFRGAVKITPPVTVDAPEWRTEELHAGGEPVGFLTAFPDGFAAAAGKEVMLFDVNGRLRRTLALDGQVGALHHWAAAKLLVAGDRAEGITAFTPDGERRWRLGSKESPGFLADNKLMWSKRHFPGVYALADAELLPGRPLLFAGSTATVEAITPAGELLDSFWQAYGPVDQLAALPAEDGHPAELFAARGMGAHPTTWGIRAQDGRPVNRNRWMVEDVRGNEMSVFGFNGVGKIQLQAVRFGTGEPARLLGAFSGAQNRAAVWDFTGKVLAGVDLGPGEVPTLRDYAVPARSDREIRALAAVDFDGDGTLGIALAHRRRLLYLFDRDFRLQKLVPLPDEPLTLAALPGPVARFAVGAGEAVLFFDGAGEPVGRATLNGRPTALLPQGNALLVGTEAGRLCRIVWPGLEPANSVRP